MAMAAGLRGVVVALAVLAGLFTMHGLTQHGDHLPPFTTTAHAADTAHDSAAVAGLTASLVVAAVAFEPDPATTDPDGSGAVALCLTVLAAACLTVWATARPRGGVLQTLAGAAMAAAPRPPVRARAPDPPGRWAISVCRC